MSKINYNLDKFVGFFQDVPSNQTNYMDQDVSKSNTTSIFPKFENYDHLKDLLKEGNIDMAKQCIEKGSNWSKTDDNTYDGTPLHLAVSLEYPDIVELLLEKGASVLSRNDCDDTPLITAAIIGNSQIIDILLKTEPENYANRQDFSHFHIACMRNNVTLVRKMLTSGVDLNKSVKKSSMFWPGFTPLHFAVEFRSIETAKFLIEKGADITIQDNRGLTPLHLAFRKRNRILIDLLLSEQYYYASNPIDSEGLSHFHIACAANKRDIVEDFLNKEIDVTHVMPGERSQSWYGHCGFQFAISNQCVEVLEYLLQCNYSTVGRDERSIIDYAYQSRNEKILNLIISSVEKDIVNTCHSSLVKKSSNKEKVHVCATDISKPTVDQCSCLEKFNVSQYTKLHVAVLIRNKDKIQSILEKHNPSVITVTDAREETSLHLAFKLKEKDLVDQLLCLHLQLVENPVNGDNFSHFHISCTSKNVSIVEDFLKKGVDVNMQVNQDALNYAGCTPLHFAVMYCRTKTVQVLLNNGADFTLKNTLDISPYDLSIPDFQEEFIVGNDDEDYNTWGFIEQILLASEERKVENFEDRGITLLHVASANGDIDKINRYTRVDTINRTVTTNLGGWYGFTPLHFAAHFGERDAVKVLLDHGADPTILNEENSLPGYYLDSTDERLHLIPKITYNYVGISIFHKACQYSSARVVEQFLKIGADVDKRIPHNCESWKNDEEGQTPLHIAALAGDAKIVELLLEHGASVDARDCYFNTPLHLCRSKEVLAVLLDHGADPEALNCEFYTTLDKTLILCVDLDFITAVIESGWDINKAKVFLGIPSNYDVLARHIERLTILGVNMNKKNKNLYDRIMKEDLAIRRASPSYKQKCANELRLMKEIEIDNCTTLYDLIFKSSSEMAKYSKNETLQKIIESDQDFRQIYPIYAYLIILQFKKGVKRAVLIEEGKKSLTKLMNRWMGDLVLEMILKSINDYEIRYLTYASSDQNIFQ